MASLRRSHRSTWRLRLLGLAALFVLLLGLFGRSLADGLADPSRAATTLPREIPHTDVNPYGANFFLTREVEPWKRDKTLRMAADAGIGWVKQQFPWEEVEPLRKGEFVDPATGTNSWTKFDEIVAACEDAGLQIVARLDRPPDWSREDNAYKERPPDHLEDYGDYVYEFVRRYRGRVNYIQIWNEPNIFPEWGNRPVDPAAYAEMLKVAYRRAKEANPNVVVLCAPLAITLGQRHPEPDRWIAMNDLQFLEEMYQAGAADYFDIYSANAFGMDRPPDDPANPQVLNFQRVLLHREIMERYGDADKAVWFNEFGWNAAPDSFASDQLVWQRVTEEQQAEYTAAAIRMAREEWPWAGVFMVWYFRHVGNIPPNRADYYFRMVDVDFTPRPLYLAIERATAGLGVAPPGTAQESSPAVLREGAWESVLSAAASGGSWLAGDTPGASVTLRFEGATVDLLGRRGPTGGRLIVALNGRPVPGLPIAADGQSYVDLYAVQEQPAECIPLVRNAAPGEQTLQLTIAEGADPESAGRECVIDAFLIAPRAGAPFPVLSLVASSLGLIADGWLLWRAWHRARWVMRAN